MSMHVRTTTDDAEEPLFDRDLAPPSQNSIEELRLTDDSEFGQGERRFILLDGIVVTRRRHEIRRDFDLSNEQETPTVTLRFCLQGEVDARLASFEGAVYIRAGDHNIVYTPERKYTHVLRRDRMHDVVEVYLTPEYLTALAERFPELLESYLSPIARQEPFRLHQEGRAITPRMQRVIHQLLDSREQEPLRRMFIEAKVTELLALQLQQHEDHAGEIYRGSDLSRPEVDRMVEARDRVVARMDDPPTLSELARQVGTNEFTLKRHFKEVFGTTVYGLLLERKMERARLLLRDTDRPIGDIARDIGYSHTAHFSTAFKKRYGVSPSVFRKER